MDDELFDDEGQHYGPLWGPYGGDGGLLEDEIVGPWLQVQLLNNEEVDTGVSGLPVSDYIPLD